MKGELSKLLKDQFNSVQEEYSLFYYHRNHPAAGVEYDDRGDLTTEQLIAWARRLSDQAQEVVIQLDQLVRVADVLHETEDLHAFRPYHEMKAYFREDVREMQDQIGRFGFAPQLF